MASQEDFQLEDEAGTTDHNLGNQEWRQLLAEAEALLVPLPEQNWGEETQRLRTASLGDGQQKRGLVGSNRGRKKKLGSNMI